MSTMLKSKKSQSRVQANVDPEIKDMAEKVIKEVGLTPTAVINGLYRKIASTGSIPLDFSLTSEQMADLELQNALKKLPVKKLRTKKELEEFFNDED
ncbi:MAG: type II toxin-antitoxin system RelB/DinJ family antitoxin [Limosilactobacillus sp.]|jgi:DNA-damage-inducible protein J|uniref:type II toxin-antitoxin system RelB/DinJ family antitoxin n=1 Tax=Limosilactobacillus sp. TaxID=2773925 RepID=UPI0025C35AEA|nr:type II toxin-antitoxin system RelB/DinJ family antitoxin [Limosilactobacillus sp.]MCI1974398.1 type II toxin-antitoxin system RelB/DinJ family antitoxin [Limosilactobacillus sp.]MCI2030585.1 type II toxin-antitoxin system RelB/DinJ family antitoxin [Limosilactobacillus sp.]